MGTEKKVRKPGFFVIGEKRQLTSDWFFFSNS